MGHALHVDESVLHDAGHAVIDRHRRASAEQVRAAGDPGVEALGAAVVDGQHEIALGLLQEECLQLLQLLRVLRGQVVGLTEVLVDVIELPDVVRERRILRKQPWNRVACRRDPAVVVDGAVAEHLEVLRLPAVCSLRVVRGVEHRHAVHRTLVHAVDRPGLGDTRGLESRRRHVDHVVELAAELAPGLDACRPLQDHAVPRAAEVTRHLLGPLEGRVRRPGPADREVREGVGTAPVVEVSRHLVKGSDDAVQRHHLVVGALGAALGARAVVADDVEEERVVEFAERLELRDESPDLVIRVLGESRERLHLDLEQPLLVGVHVVPGRDLFRPRGEFRIGRDHPHCLLAREGLLAEPVPAARELATVLRRPLPRHVVRRVCRAGRKVHIERLVGRQGVLRAHPLDRLVRHVGREVIVGRPLMLDARHAVEDCRRPLVGLAADEAVELVEARPGRPAIEGAGRRDFPGRRLVVLAEGGRAVAVHAQDLRERRHALRPDARIAGEGRRQLHDRAGIVDVVIAAGEQRDARRAAERGGVEAVVAQPVRGHLLERRHVDGPAE